MNPAIKCLVILPLLLTSGCGKPKPTPETVRAAVDGQIPPHFSLVDVVWEATEPNDGELALKFEATITPKEDLFSKSSGSTALSAIQGELLDQSVEGKINEALSAEASQAVMDAGAKTVFLQPEAKAGETVTIYGRIPGEYLENKVVLGDPLLQEAGALNALPKSSFPDSAIVIGSLAEQQKIAEVREKIRQLTESDAKRAREKAADLKQQEESLLEMFKPGQKLTGLARNERFTDPIEMIVAENSDPAGKLLRVRMQNPADPGMYRDYTGTLDLAAVPTPARPVAVLTGQPPVQDFKDPRNLYGPIRQIYGRAEGSTITVFFTGTGLRGECSGYRAPEILLEKGR